jgi:outer membrane protein insertion porin family
VDHPEPALATQRVAAYVALVTFLSTGPLVQAEIIESVRVEGTRRSLHLSVEAGQPLDERRIEQEVRRLWATNLFDDVQVQADQSPTGMKLVFQVAEKRRYFLREVRVEPKGTKLPFDFEPGMFIDPGLARQFALNVRRRLIEDGHVDADVIARHLPAGGAQADLLVRIEEGPAYQVERVEFAGLTEGASAPLRKELRSLRSRRILPGVPALWKGWTLRPAFSEQKVAVDTERLRSHLLAQGYLDAEVRLERVDFDNDGAAVTFGVRQGSKFSAREVRTMGFTSTVDLPQNTVFPSDALCRCLLQARQQAEREGRLDFNARIEIERATLHGEQNAVNVMAVADPGPAYRLKRITFRGHHDLPDSTLRRTLLLDEGDVFDTGKLRESLLRLNRISGLEPLDETSVSVVQNPAAQEAELVISVRERKRGRWSLSGPLGPVSLSGPVQFMLDGRLPPWGGRLLDLSTYTAFVSLSSFSSPLWQLLGWEKETLWLPTAGITRSYLPGREWRSGFVLSPQFGWHATSASYASTQARERLLGLLAPRDSGQAALAVRVVRQSEKPQDTARTLGHLLCERPQPRWGLARKAAQMTLQWLAATPL